MAHEITENGITYIVEGDYPDGKYVKHIKDKGIVEEKKGIDEQLNEIKQIVEHIQQIVEHL